MPTLSQSDMIEATRLTREGRLQEAMALLQGIRDATSSGAEEQRPWTGPSRRPMQQVIDMVPPADPTKGAWTAPSPGAGAAELQWLGRNGSPQGLTDRFVAPNLRSKVEDGLNSTILGKLRSLGRTAGAAVPPRIPEGAKFEDHLFTNAFGSRPYKLYRPSTNSDRPKPLIVMLHGCTQSPDDFAAGTRMNELAEEFGFLVAYPAQTQAANISRCWNWFNAADQQRDKGEPSLIAGITSEVMQEFSVQRGKVYIAGLSAGGAKAAIMGATYPDLYASVGVHSGLACGAARDMAQAFAAMRQGGGAIATDHAHGPVRTIVFHGDRDATVHPVNGDEVAAQARGAERHQAEVERGSSAAGMDYTRRVHRDESGRTMLEQWVLHGAGHAWSGGSSAGSYTDPRGPDASREMVRFFLEQEM